MIKAMMNFDDLKRWFVFNPVIIPTQGISYPRSGRGLLKQSVQAYFSNHKLNDTPTYRNEGLISDGINFSRNHDFEHAIQKDDDCKYIVQYRNPVRSILSHCKLFYAGKIGNLKRVKLAFDHNPYGLKHWVYIINNWVLSPPKNALLIDYQDLVGDHEKTMERVVKFISNGRFSRKKYLKTLPELDVKPRHNLENDINVGEYEKFFDFVEERMSVQIEKCNLLNWREAF